AARLADLQTNFVPSEHGTRDLDRTLTVDTDRPFETLEARARDGGRASDLDPQEAPTPAAGRGDGVDRQCPLGTSASRDHGPAAGPRELRRHGLRIAIGGLGFITPEPSQNGDRGVARGRWLERRGACRAMGAAREPDL